MRLKMAESVKQAVKMVEQGHVRVGPNTITDPAFLVTRYEHQVLQLTEVERALLSS